MNNNKTAIWAGASVVGILMICVTVLAALNKDTTAILTVVAVVITPLLGALGYSKISGLEQKTEAVVKQTNGNATQQMDFIREMVREAMSQQKPRPPADGEPAA